jgi:hypothetical protein
MPGEVRLGCWRSNKGMKLTKRGQLRSFAAYPRCLTDYVDEPEGVLDGLASEDRGRAPCPRESGVGAGLTFPMGFGGVTQPGLRSVGAVQQLDEADKARDGGAERGLCRLSRCSADPWRCVLALR